MLSWVELGRVGPGLARWARLRARASGAPLRFCKNTFDKNYKATIGVDFEMERFEVLGIPFSLQL